ncbi:hypothetical protein Tco_0331102 [Tanacetum coccineum]
MMETLPSLVKDKVTEKVKKEVPAQVRDQVPVYLAEGLIMERKTTKEETERLISKAILQECGSPSTYQKSRQEDESDFWTDSYSSDDDEDSNKQSNTNCSEEKAKGSRKKMLGKKRSGKEQQQESSNRQRMEDDKETDEHEEVEVDDEVELKKYLVIVKDDDIAIDAIPLATKPPVIVEYKHLKEGIMPHYQLIRANGSSKRYSSMIRMLQDINREDLETLWKLVKTKHGDIRPEDEHERMLWSDLKVMFKPDIKSDVWRNLQGYRVTIWKLHDSCGVHFVSQYPDAKTMFVAIETRFRGNEATKKTQKTLLKQQYENFSASSAESLDSIFNRLQKIVSRLAILGVVIAQEDLNLKILSSFPPEWNTHVNPNGSNLLHQDLEQIHEDDLEAMDLKWQLSLLSMRAKRECRAPRRKEGFDWSDMAEDQVQTNMAIMAKQCDDLIVKLNQTEFIATTYKRGLATVEEQLITYRKNEVRFSEEVAVLKREVACKDYEINVLKSVGLDESNEPDFNGYGPET